MASPQDASTPNGTERSSTRQELLDSIVGHGNAGKPSSKGITRIELPLVDLEQDGYDCAFFYGTLMHPAVVRRVLGSDCSHLHMCPAILYVRTLLALYHGFSL